MHRFLLPALHPRGDTAAPILCRPADIQSWWRASTVDITQSWTIRVTAGVEYHFAWGDGTWTHHTGNGANQVVAHNYGGAGTYRVRFWIDDPATLMIFYCNSNSLVGVIPDLSANTALTTFHCGSNSLVGVIPDLSANTALMIFYCYSNSLVGVIPDLSANTALTTVYCYWNSLTGYTAGVIAATCTTFRAEANALSLAAVDQILTDFTTGSGGRPGAGTINLSGGTSATPTAAVKAACVAALPGWTIVTN